MVSFGDAEHNDTLHMVVHTLPSSGSEAESLGFVDPFNYEVESLGISEFVGTVKRFLGFSDKNNQLVSLEKIKDHFMPFMLNKTPDDSSLISPLSSQPELAGDENQPDVALAMNLMALHLGVKDKEGIDRDTCITMRIDVTQDDNGGESRFDNLKWVIASSIKLINQAKGIHLKDSEIQAKSDDALGKRPIEIPGGLGQIRLTMTKNKASIWKDFADMAVGDFGQSMVSMLGLPIIAGPLMNFVDQLLDRMFQGDIIFDGGFVPFAFSMHAKNQLQQMLGPAAPVSSLNPGIYIFMRNEDYYLMREQGAIYPLAYKRLFPKTDPKTLEAIIAGKEPNPFDDITYGVFQFRMREAKFLASSELGQ